jgi:SnoaL-like domain
MNDVMIQDRFAIQDTITDLFVGTDNRDWEMVKRCFAPSVLFDMSSLTGSPAVTLVPQQIADGWDSALRALEGVHHQAGNFRISIHGDQADATCYAVAWHFRRNRSEKNTRQFVGSYDFHLCRQGERWTIDVFRFNLKFIDGNAFLEQD